MTTTVVSLARYPVKGLSADMLKCVSLQTGEGFPCDRQFGFARPGSGFDPVNPKPLPKHKFYMLARDESLSQLESKFDETKGTLVLSFSTDNSTETETFDITSVEGRNNAAKFLAAYLGLSDEQMPQLYEASPHRFTDVSVVSAEMMNAVSIINLDSVKAFAQAIGQDVDPRRFRGNIHISNLPAFSELEMVGQTMTIGSVQLKLVKRTRRCPATEVDLVTGQRNMKTPILLREHYGHMDMGVYAEVVAGGVISPGDKVEIP